MDEKYLKIIEKVKTLLHPGNVRYSDRVHEDLREEVLAEIELLTTIDPVQSEPEPSRPVVRLPVIKE